MARSTHDSLGLTLRSHPLALLRFKLPGRCLLTAVELNGVAHCRLAQACGFLTTREQPGTSNGVVFVRLEHETGTVNVIVWRSLPEQQRRELLHSRLLAVYGVWQCEGCTTSRRRWSGWRPRAGISSDPASE